MSSSAMNSPLGDCGADRTRLPSVNALSQFLHGQGHGRTQKRPGRDSYLASVQPPGPDQPWHSAQPSAVCQLLTNALQHSLYSGCSAAIRDSAPSWPLGSRLHSRWTCTCPRDHPIFKMREGDSPAYVHALSCDLSVGYWVEPALRVGIKIPHGPGSGCG